MIVPDVNLLLYAYRAESLQHEVARRWWESLLNGSEEVGIPWAVSMGFARVMSNPRISRNAVPPLEAVGYTREWFELDHIRPLNPGERHLQILRDLLDATSGTASVAAANRVPDAHIAAIALEHDSELHSSDADFARFPGLRWRNPLH